MQHAAAFRCALVALRACACAHCVCVCVCVCHVCPHTHTHTQREREREREREHAQTLGGIAVGFDDEAHKSKTVARGDVDELKLSQQNVISLRYKKKIKEKHYKNLSESSWRAAMRGLDPTPEAEPNPKS